jgi:hypothetical protein
MAEVQRLEIEEAPVKPRGKTVPFPATPPRTQPAPKPETPTTIEPSRFEAMLRVMVQALSLRALMLLT